jgi:hypothetical protein
VPGDPALSRFNHATAVLALGRYEGLRRGDGSGMIHNAVLNLASMCAQISGAPTSYDEAFMQLALGAVDSGSSKRSIEPDQLTLIAWSAPDAGQRYDAALFGSPQPSTSRTAAAAQGAFGQVLHMLQQPWQREPTFVFFATLALRDRGGRDWLRYRELLLDRFARNQSPDGEWSPWHEPSCVPGGDVYTTAMHVLSLHACLGSLTP